MKPHRIALISLLLLVLCGGAVYAAFQSEAAPAVPLAAYAPPGALLAIESPDFAALLKSWNNSAEQKRWLAGADYAGFSRSRLFDRLSKAQDEFAATAGLDADTNFLQQIAGGQSLFAWYDIGNLEFLYITRLPVGEAAKTPLLQLRAQFEQRQAGDTAFYVRTQTDPARTVAFAVRGDYLLLATREDLLANALQQMQQPSQQPDARTLQHDPWYAATVAAAGKPGDLRMTLNLKAIVPSPYFRSYWIQQNITELKPYTAALSDLYRSANTFREERLLLAADPSAHGTDTDLSPVLAYLPTDAGVYRAQAQPSTTEVLDQLEDKLLSRQPSAYRDPHLAPVADLSTPTSGEASDFEQRIDASLVVSQPRAASLARLQTFLTASPPSAMLAFSTARPMNGDAPETTDSVFHSLHTAVVLAAATPWDTAALQQNLSAALSPRLSIASAGLIWTDHHDGASTWYELTGLQPLALAVQDNLCILASDRATLLQLLAASTHAAHTPTPAGTIAGFHHGTERGPLIALSSTLDHASASPRPNPGNAPPFFSSNMVSLSDTFRDLDAETFTQTTAPDGVIHQTVLYQWR